MRPDPSLLDALDPASLDVLVEIRGTLRLLVRALERASRQAGLTEPQQHALLCIAHGERAGNVVTPTTLMGHLATDKNTVADVVRRLVAHGLIARQRVGRSVLLRLTDAGRERFAVSLARIGEELGASAVLDAGQLAPQIERYLQIYQELAARLASPSDGASQTSLHPDGAEDAGAFCPAPTAAQRSEQVQVDR